MLLPSAGMSERVRATPTPVVVVHRDRPQRLDETLAALARSTVPVRAIVVDSGSSADASAEAAAAVERRFPTDGVFLPGQHNTGFGPSANRGWRHALRDGTDWEWVGLCPHDALVEPDTVSRMLDALAERPGAGLACADYGDAMSPRFDRMLGAHLEPSTVTEGWDPVDYPHGTFLLARRELLETVGMFDERYFAYCEETDLGLRAADAGWQTGLVRGAMVINPETNTAVAVVDYLQTRNTVQLVRRRSGRWPAVFRFTVAAWQTLRGEHPSPYRRGLFFHRTARMRALRDALIGRTGPPP